jgi:dolichyl-phosphate beta-glucosyltransferase
MDSIENPLPLSIVIPCYKEEKRLEPGLSRAIDYLSSHVQGRFELIFVNDGSTDRTVEILEAAKQHYAGIPMEIASYLPNRGKGYAVRTGVLHSRGNQVLVMDADFSIELSEMFKFLAALDAVDIVIGTKKHRLTQTLKPQDPLRRFLGKGYTVLAGIVLGLRFSDITCSFKAFRGEVARDIFRRQKINRWSYDSETLFLAKKLRYTTRELPVKWHHEEQSRVSPFIDTLRSSRELLAILSNYYTGKYGL